MGSRSGYVHATPMPDELLGWSADERERRCRSDGDLLLVDGGDRGFLRVTLSLPMRHDADEVPLSLVAWAELTKGAWRSLRSVERPGTSAEVAAILASRIPGLDGAIGEHVRVRRTAEEPRARVVAAGKGKLARLERPRSLAQEDRRRIEAAIADSAAPALVEGFLAEKIASPTARWRGHADAGSAGDLQVVRVEGPRVLYVTVGASSVEQVAGDDRSRIELALHSRADADAVAPPMLLALAAYARARRAQLVPGMRIELPGVSLLPASAATPRGDARSHLWLAPADVGDLRGGPLTIGPVHLHFVRVVPLHAAEDALLEREGVGALVRRLEARGLDPTDLTRGSAVAA